jgi:hypothetical protein
MSKSHFNYTGRRPIRRQDVMIEVKGDLPDARVDALFALEKYGFPDTARVVLEAQAGWTVQRFDWGTVDRQEPTGSSVLSEFGSLAGLHFRIKVLDSEQMGGRILGEADRLRPTGTVQEPSQKSFVVVRPADLGEVPWRVTFDDAQPLLEINRRFGDFRAFMKRREVASLVLPEVFRQILFEATMDVDDPEELDGWQSQAARHAERIGAGPLPADRHGEALEDWIEGAVNAFATRFRCVAKLLSHLEADE